MLSTNHPSPADAAAILLVVGCLTLRTVHGLGPQQTDVGDSCGVLTHCREVLGRAEAAAESTAAAAGRGASAERPNILLVLSDQHRGDWLGFRGDASAVATPNIDRLAREGVAFTHAWSPSPLCAPARACLATALPFDKQPVKTNDHDLPAGASTIYHDLRKTGYEVMSCGKVDLLKMSKDWGTDGLHNRSGSSRFAGLGFTAGEDSAGKEDGANAARHGRPHPYAGFLRLHGLLEEHLTDMARRKESMASPRGFKATWLDRYTNTQPTPLPEDAYQDNWIGGRCFKLLEQAPGDRPWFLQANFVGPHEPLDITRRMHDRWAAASKLPPPANHTQLSAAAHLDVRRNYAAMIENIDAWLGRFVALLGVRGQRGRTLVVYTSDHGEQLGDYDKWAKVEPEHGSLLVPLVMAGPGVRSNAPVRTPVDLVDLARTLLDWAGAAPQRELGGGSLRDALEGRELAWRYRTAGIGSWRAISDGRYKYVHNWRRDQRVPELRVLHGQWNASASAPASLFSLTEDAAEGVDLLPSRPLLAAEYRRRLLELLGQQVA